MCYYVSHRQPFGRCVQQTQAGAFVMVKGTPSCGCDVTSSNSALTDALYTLLFACDGGSICKGSVRCCERALMKAGSVRLGEVQLKNFKGHRGNVVGGMETVFFVFFCCPSGFYSEAKTKTKARCMEAIEADARRGPSVTLCKFQARFFLSWTKTVNRVLESYGAAASGTSVRFKTCILKVNSGEFRIDSV